MKTWWIIGILAWSTGCAPADQAEGKREKMQDQIEELLSTYADIYTSPKEGRISDLEAKFADLDYLGLYIGAPDVSDGSMPGIPILALTGNTLLRAWEVDARLNTVLVVADLERGVLRTWPLYKPPAKTLKPTPKPAKPMGEAADAQEFGCIYRLAGESMSDGLPSGFYAVSLVEWDRVSNIRTVRKAAKPSTSSTPLAEMPINQWPWAYWNSHSADFQAHPESPQVEGEPGLAAALVGSGDKARVMVSLAVKARPLHRIPPDSAPDTSRNGIRYGIPVDLLQFTRNQTMPDRIQVLVPVYATAPVKQGEALKAWLAYPLAKLQREQETLIYAFVDGMRSGPIRIPALNQ